MIGVTPKMFIDLAITRSDLSELRVVETMHERKALIAELADGFVAMPGGMGTFEELLEILTWAQLGIHNKPCGVLNVCGYYDKLIDLLDHAVSQRFISTINRERLLADEDPVNLLKKLTEFRSPDYSHRQYLDL